MKSEIRNQKSAICAARARRAELADTRARRRFVGHLVLPDCPNCGRNTVYVYCVKDRTRYIHCDKDKGGCGEFNDKIIL